MLEAGGKEAPIEMIHDALPVAQDALGELAAIQEAFLAKVGHLPELQITKNLPSEPLIAAVKAQVPDSLWVKLSVAEKREFDMLYAQMETDLLTYFATSVDQEELPWTKNQIKMSWFKVLKYWIRDRVMTEGKRIDGRGVEQIRSIYCELDTVPRAHGT